MPAVVLLGRGEIGPCIVPANPGRQCGKRLRCTTGVALWDAMVSAWARWERERERRGGGRAEDLVRVVTEVHLPPRVTVKVAGVFDGPGAGVVLGDARAQPRGVGVRGAAGREGRRVEQGVDEALPGRGLERGLVGP